MARRTTTEVPKNVPLGAAATGSTMTATVAPSKTLAGYGRPTREQIAARAQEIYKRRCHTREPGDAVSDWLKAEAELNAASHR